MLWCDSVVCVEKPGSFLERGSGGQFEYGVGEYSKLTERESRDLFGGDGRVSAEPGKDAAVRGDWDKLEEELRSCRYCGLCEHRRNVVIGRGSLEPVSRAR